MVELTMYDNRNSVAFGICDVVLNILFNGNAYHEYLKISMQNILLSFTGLHMLCLNLYVYYLTCLVLKQNVLLAEDRGPNF